VGRFTGNQEETTVTEHPAPQPSGGYEHRGPHPDGETKGLVDQVLAPAAIALSGGVGMGLGQAAGDVIKDKLTKPQSPPPADE
jgi:hypothetical protein